MILSEERNLIFINIILVILVLYIFKFTIGSISLIVISILSWMIYYFNSYRSKRNNKVLNMVWYMTVSIIVTFVSVFLVLVGLICTELKSQVKDYRDIDYAIILGAGLKGDKVSNKLKIRLDTAIEEIKYKNIPIIVSGGQGKDEEISESQAMYNYLVTNGIDKKRIVQENKSTSTWENISFSNNIMNKENLTILIFTSDYHMYRSKMLGRRVGWNVLGYSCSNSFTVRLNYMIREVGALAKDILIRLDK